jgi:hypothetical protein
MIGIYIITNEINNKVDKQIISRIGRKVGIYDYIINNYRGDNYG